jgi:hypothetical protein
MKNLDLETNRSGDDTPGVSTTRVWRSNTGWEARTEIELGHQLVLMVTTRRNVSRGTLRSNATVHHKSGSVLSHALYQDFSQELRDIPMSRVTEGAVTSEHEFNLRDIEKTKVAALRVYGHVPQATQAQQKAGD